MNKLFYIFTITICLFSFSSINAQEVTVERIPGNSSLKNDFAPFVLDSVLYFASNRKHEVLKSYLDQNNESLYRIYMSVLLQNDDYGVVRELNSDRLCKLNTASINASRDGSKIFITQNQYTSLKRSQDRENLLGVFIIDVINGKWGRPTSFEFNSRRSYSCGHPTVSPDGKTLFYVSNQEDGFGETDIYMSVYDGTNWSEPKNLGKTINTSGKEIFPFYHPSGKLYFSSNGINGKGDFDIYYTTFDGKNWAKPTALDSPVNSDKDDFSCYIFPGETEGFFASNRAGSDDIYKFSNPFPTFPDAKPQKDDNFCFTLFENGPFKSDTLPYIYKWYFGDGQSAKGLEVRHCFPGPGKYDVHLNVEDTLANEDLFTVAQYELELTQTTQIYITAPDTVKINTPINLSASNSVLKDFKPSQYYWYLDETNKSKGVTITHIFRKKGVYTITCGALSVDDPKNKMSSTKQIVVIE